MNMKKAILISTSLLISQIPTVTATSMINEAPDNHPEWIKLTGDKEYHPIFGELHVISHKKDIDYYDSKATISDNKEELAQKFVDYVVHESSFKDKEIKKDELTRALQVIAETKSGMNMLKVIIANYMREHYSLKKFYDKN